MKTVKTIGKTDALTLANYILKGYGPMSHLKLQKLLFYCEAYHLALFGKSLIDEDFEAWVHGPVCREVYDALKGSSVLYSDVEYDKENGDPVKEIEKALTSDQIELIDSVLNQLHKWKSFELERATHDEKPWIEAREGYGRADRCEVKISKKTMKDFYRAEMNG